MKTRSVEDVDADLNRLRNIAADCLRDSEQWNTAWERINELLEERTTMPKIPDFLKEEV